MHRVIAISLFILIGYSAYPQDPQFTQFYSNPLYLAPSYAGGIAGHRMVGIYRNQWALVPGTFQTYAFSYDHNFINFKSGLGLLVFNDVAGDANLGTTKVGLLYSYDITPSPEWHIRPGVGFYYIQQGLNYSKLLFGDQLVSDPMPPSSIQPLGNESIHDIDVTTSIIAYSNNIWFGATWDHMLRPSRTFYGDENARTPFKISAYGGYRHVIRGILFRPIEESVTGTFKFRHQGLFRQLDLGVYWYRQPFMFGVWYRGIPIAKTFPNSDAVALMAGVRLIDLSLTYSYDVTVSRLGFGTGGSHELSVSYTFRIQPRRRWRAIPCPAL